jgi:hypothetical protein
MGIAPTAKAIADLTAPTSSVSGNSWGPRSPVAKTVPGQVPGTPRSYGYTAAQQAAALAGTSYPDYGGVFPGAKDSNGNPIVAPGTKQQGIK